MSLKRKIASIVTDGGTAGFLPPMFTNRSMFTIDHNLLLKDQNIIKV